MLTTTQVNLKSSLGRSAGRFLAKRGMATAMFVAIVGVVVWIAVPSPSPPRGAVEASQHDRSVRPLPVVPSPVAGSANAVSAPSPIPSPAVAPAMVGQDADAPPVVDAAPHPETARPSSALPKASLKQRPTRSVASARPAPVRASAATASGTHSVTHTGTHTQTSSPRAGALTPDDF